MVFSLSKRVIDISTEFFKSIQNRRDVFLCPNIRILNQVHTWSIMILSMPPEGHSVQSLLKPVLPSSLSLFEKYVKYKISDGPSTSKVFLPIKRVSYISHYFTMLFFLEIIYRFPPPARSPDRPERRPGSDASTGQSRARGSVGRDSRHRQAGDFAARRGRHTLHRGASAVSSAPVARRPA